ncbi:MAG: ribosome recycling factor [Ilumatobacteraceae bacterium]
MAPNNDGVVIRLNFLADRRATPRLRQGRQEHGRDGRIAVRNLRRDARKVMEQAKTDGDISEDELDRAEKELEKITLHDHVEKIDAALGRKEAELLEV